MQLHLTAFSVGPSTAARWPACQAAAITRTLVCFIHRSHLVLLRRCAEICEADLDSLMSSPTQGHRSRGKQ